jgi:hypothetical protein
MGELLAELANGKVEVVAKYQLTIAQGSLDAWPAQITKTLATLIRSHYSSLIYLSTYAMSRIPVQPESPYLAKPDPQA